MHPLQDYQNNSSAGKLLFFDRAKKSLENREVYDDFLKLLNLFSRDVIDVEVLIERAKVFLSDGELMAEFKDLMGWDDRDKIEKGPPGSIRTGPPELPAALPVDDGEGPSYRKLPPSVRPFDVVALFMLTSSLPVGNGFGMFGPRRTLPFGPKRSLGFSSNLGFRRLWIRCS